jgi:type IV pilus assembly protein PilO
MTPGAIDHLLAQPARIRIGLLTLAAVLAGGLDWALAYGPRAERLGRLEADVVARRAELAAARDGAGRRATLEVAGRERAAELTRAAAGLPAGQEIADLLSSIAASGRAAGLDIVLFRQKLEIRRDGYAEVPVQMALRGTYDNLLSFLERVRRLDRIVAVSDLRLAKPRIEGERLVLDVSGIATTFRLLEPAAARGDHEDGGP